MYNVAFRYTAEAGPYKGGCTYTQYKSKEDFDSKYTEEIRKREEVIEEGVSTDRCEALCSQTPLSTKLRVALHECTDSETGETNEYILGLKMIELKMSGAI